MHKERSNLSSRVCISIPALALFFIASKPIYSIFNIRISKLEVSAVTIFDSGIQVKIALLHIPCNETKQASSISHTKHTQQTRKSNEKRTMLAIFYHFGSDPILTNSKLSPRQHNPCSLLSSQIHIYEAGSR